MSAFVRLGPALARSAVFQYPSRHMATANVSEPVQRLFVDKIKEFKSANKGLDAAHERLLTEEMARLKRVYRVDDENKLAHIENKFSNEHNVSLRDLDDTKELRRKVDSGEYQKQLAAQSVKPSAILASIPEQVTGEMELPPLNKPDPMVLLNNAGTPGPITLSEPEPDYKSSGEIMTPEKLQREMLVKFDPEMPTIHDDKAPGRDAVNFPRIPQPMDTPPTRYHIIPESWFRFFYPKTGVTGPYIFTGALSTFLLSKEWLVWEHELLTGVTTTIIIAYAVKRFGPQVSSYCRTELKKEMDDWDTWRLGNIESLQNMQTHYKNEMGKSAILDDLYEIRHQDVELQLEGEYRARLKAIYDDTKRRLNYLVATADSQRQIAHKNMVNWVISNAISSIGPKQETEVLDDCIVSLKQLASKNVNVI